MENGDTELMSRPRTARGRRELRRRWRAALIRRHWSRPRSVCPATRTRPTPTAARCAGGRPAADHPAGAPPGRSGSSVPPDGSSMLIDRPILVGRAPVLRDDLSEVPELMRVPSPGAGHQPHAPAGQPRPVGDRLTDLHSTNGTVIVRPGPGVDRLQLQPGEPHWPSTVGTVVELGDGVAVLVDGPPRPAARRRLIRQPFRPEPTSLGRLRGSSETRRPKGVSHARTTSSDDRTSTRRSARIDRSAAVGRLVEVGPVWLLLRTGGALRLPARQQCPDHAALSGCSPSAGGSWCGRNAPPRRPGRGCGWTACRSSGSTTVARSAGDVSCCGGWSSRVLPSPSSA